MIERSGRLSYLCTVQRQERMPLFISLLDSLELPPFSLANSGNFAEALAWILVQAWH